MEAFGVLFAGGIFFVSLIALVITALSLGFLWASSNFKRLEKGQAKLAADISEIKQLLKNR